MPHTYQALIRKAWLLVLLSLAGLAWLIWVPSETVLMYTVGFSFISVAFGALLLLAVEYSGGVRNWIPYRIVAWFGVYSYGLYLWHSAVRDGVRNLVEKHLPQVLWWPVGLPLQIASAAVIAVIATRIIEWPFLRWREYIPYLRDDRKPLLSSDHQIPRRTDNVSEATTTTIAQ